MSEPSPSPASLIPIRVGEIPYLNCAPFFWNREAPAPLELRCVQVPPRELGRLARRGQIDSGPVSLMDSFALSADFEPLADFGIAAPERAQSVLLFSKLDWPRLAGKTIGMTEESSTSTRLLEVLLRSRHGVEAILRRGFSGQDEARLLIGNQALISERAQDFRRVYPRVFDLGAEWRVWQKLPFVFARWMVRKELDGSAKAGLAQWLARNLEGCGNDFAGPAAWFARTYNAASLPGSADYLKGFRYRLAPAEQEAILRFRELVGSLEGLAPAHV